MMRVFTESELLRLQGAQDAGMMDTCQILSHFALGADAYGEPYVGYTAGAALSCGFDPGPRQELLFEAGVPTADAVVRLPIYTVVDPKDVLRVTHRFGVALPTALDFSMIGTPERGPSGLVLKLKTRMGGFPVLPWWAAAGVLPWAAYAAFGAESFAASLVDLTGQGRDLGIGAVPPWDAVDGWGFAGSHYLTTTFMPGEDQAQTMAIQYKDASVGMVAAYLAGCGLLQHSYGLQADLFGTGATYYNGGGTPGVRAVPTGNLMVAEHFGYLDGVEDATWNDTDYGQPVTHPVAIGCNNADGAFGSYVTADMLLIAFFDQNLVSAQAAALATAMAAEVA